MKNAVVATEAISTKNFDNMTARNFYSKYKTNTKIISINLIDLTVALYIGFPPKFVRSHICGETHKVATFS